MLELFPSLTPIFVSLRNLRSRPWRTLLTTMGIMIGVAVVLAIEITNVSTLDSLERTFDRTVGQAELLVIPPADEPTLAEELLTRVQRTSGVQIAAPTTWARTVLADHTGSMETYWGAEGVRVGRPFEIRGIDPILDPEVRVYVLTGGRFPHTDQYEALLPQKTAQDKELEIGDDLVFLTPYGSERLQIVGLLSDEGAGLINDGAIAFTSIEALQEIFDLGEGLNEIAVQVEPSFSSDPQALAALKLNLEERLANQARLIYPAARGQLVPRMLDSYQIGLMFFSIIAVFVGAFLIYNTFSMTLVERTREVGMLRAIGMDRKQVWGMVFTEAGLLSIAGSLLGLGAGLFLARGLIWLAGGFLDLEQNLVTVTRESVLVSAGLGIFVTFVAAFLPAVQAANISPLEALRHRSRAIDRVRPLVWLSGLALLFIGWAALYRLEWRVEVLIPAGSTALMLFLLGAVLSIPLVVGSLERSARIQARVLFGNEGALGSANIRRSVSRTMLTVACIMIALVMIIGIGTLSHSFKEDLSSWVNNALGGDLFIRASDPLRETFVPQLEDVPGVQYVSPMRYHPVRIAKYSLSSGGDQEDQVVFTAIVPAKFRQIGDMEFSLGQGSPDANWSALSSGDHLFISSVVAEELGIQQGDTLRLHTRRGEHDFTIAAVTTDFTGQGYVVTGTYSDLKRWFAESGVDRVSVRIAPGFDVQSVAQEIKDRYKDRYNIEILTTENLRSSVIGLTDQAFLLFDVLSMIGLVIGALGVINTLTMNVLERTREIGTLRSLGMVRAQVVRMVLAEAMALSTMGSIYGVLFGFAISKVFVDTMATLTSYEITYLFSLRPYILGVLVTFGVSQAAAFGPARRAAHVNIVEALLHE